MDLNSCVLIQPVPKIKHFSVCSSHSPLFQYRLTRTERGWEIEEDGRDILSPPEDANLWIHGRIEGLDDTFEKTIKPQALQELSKPSQFFETRYQEGTILPERWHEGHKPRPFFWSNKQWDWFCEGNINPYDHFLVANSLLDYYRE